MCSSPLLRYYRNFTFSLKGEPALRIRVHSNKLCLVFLENNHPAITAEVLSVETTRPSEVSGKKKRGATFVQPDTVIAHVRTHDLNYPIRAGVEGKLIEINEALADAPELIKEPEGYIAIIMPHLAKLEKALSKLTPVNDGLC